MSAIKTAPFVFIQYEDNGGNTRHFPPYSSQRQTTLESLVRVRPHVGSATGTNKNLLLNPMVLTCWYEQLQIFNWGPYVQDVLILQKKVCWTSKFWLLLQLDFYVLISFTNSTFAHLSKFLHRANSWSHIDRAIAFSSTAFYCRTPQSVFYLFSEESINFEQGFFKQFYCS